MNWLRRWEWLKAYRTAVERKEGTPRQRREYIGRYNTLKFWWMKPLKEMNDG